MGRPYHSVLSCGATVLNPWGQGSATLCWGNNTNQDEDPNSAAKFFEVEEDEEKPFDRAGLRDRQGTGGICTDNGGDTNTKGYTVTIPKERNEGKWRVIALLEEDYKMVEEIIKEEPNTTRAATNLTL